MHELIKCDISNISSNLKHMKIILKMNPKCHLENEIEFTPYELTSDTKHVHQELEELLLSKEGISKIQFLICKLYYVLFEK